MKLVVVESPYAGQVAENVAYAKRCVVDCLGRGEAGLASHLMWAQPGILDDLDPAQRDLGIRAGFAWGAAAESVIFYVDRGVSKGMLAGVKAAMERDSCIEVRALDREVTHADLVALGLREGSPS